MLTPRRPQPVVALAPFFPSHECPHHAPNEPVPPIWRHSGCPARRRLGFRHDQENFVGGHWPHGLRHPSPPPRRRPSRCLGPRHTNLAESPKWNEDVSRALGHRPYPPHPALTRFTLSTMVIACIRPRLSGIPRR